MSVIGENLFITTGTCSTDFHDQMKKKDNGRRNIHIVQHEPHEKPGMNLGSLES